MKKDKELAITPSDVGSQDLAKVMDDEASKRALITQYISKHMKSGTDFGTIRFGNKESKPSLFKPGSEKFLSLFKLTAKFEKDADTWEMAGSEKGVFAYKCLLTTKQGEVVGEGRGVSKLSEKAGWTINNAVKIAEKRAQIDAVLRTGALSDFFTQDLEDMTQSYDTSPVEDKAVPTVTYDDPEVPSSTPWKKKGKTDLQKKKEIMELVDSIALAPLEKTKEAYENYIFENYELALEPQFYDEIIISLTKTKNGENEEWSSPHNSRS